MKPEYFSYVERDPRLLAAVTPVLPELRSLSAEQVETLVFYLKSLHLCYPHSENHTANLERFSERLKSISESAEQTALQKRASAKLFKAMTTCVVAGALIAIGAALVVAGSEYWGGAMIAVAVALFIFAEAKYGKPALVTAKEQDRRYFLQCIRAARACNELDWLGLSSHNGVTQPGPQSDAAIKQTSKRVAELTAQLRGALYNDEYIEYSSQR